MAKRFATLVLAPLLLLAGCGDRAATQNEAVDVARAYIIAQHGPLPDGYILRVTDAIDFGDRWRLSLVVTPVGTGGGYMVVVNKHRGEVVHMEASQ